MRAGYKVLWTAVAESDLREIVTFIARDSPANALTVLNKIRESASTLYASPEHGRIVPELHAEGIVIYRELIVSPWRLLYRIADGNVYVSAVLDSRRNVEDILLQRLIKP
jgi:toxin ParE1/3/4